jgi:hypothetical protein
MKLLAKSFIWLIAGVLLVVLCVVAYAYLRTYSQQRRAEQLLVIVTRLAVGKTSEAEAMEKVQPFLAGFSSQGAGAGENYRSFIFDNLDMNRLRLADYRTFGIVLRFRDGVLVEKGANFIFWGELGYGCKVDVEDRVQDPVAALEYGNHFRTNYGFVDDDTYPESLKSLDWKFNLRHLTDFGSRRNAICKDPRLILPALAR